MCALCTEVMRQADLSRPKQTDFNLRIATYNIHRCRGMDRRVMPRRIADVLRSIQADVIALQEVFGPGPKGPGHAEELGAWLGMGWVLAPTRYVRRRLYGNAVMSRFPINHSFQYDLTWKKRIPRGCQQVEIQIDRKQLTLYNVHLGMGLRERQYQARRLCHIIEQVQEETPKVVLGDFNEWGRGVAASELTNVLKSLDLHGFIKQRRTYPGLFPLLHLDHIFYDGSIEVMKVDVPRTRHTLIASDHLPLVADIRIRHSNH